MDHYKILAMDKIRGKKGGVVTGTIFGIGGLIIGVIVILIITSTIGNAGLIDNDAVDTFSVTNYSATITGSSILVLPTYTADEYFSGWNASRIINGSVTSPTNQTLVEGTDYKIFSSNGSIANLTTWSQSKARITYTWTKTNTASKDVVTDMRGNFTDGIDNVSSKLPTILLIVAVVFLFGALVLLVRQAGLMGIGGSQNGSL